MLLTRRKASGRKLHIWQPGFKNGVTYVLYEHVDVIPTQIVFQHMYNCTCSTYDYTMQYGSTACQGTSLTLALWHLGNIGEIQSSPKVSLEWP